MGTATTLGDKYHDDMFEIWLDAFPEIEDDKGYSFFRSCWRGMKEFVEVVKVDGDGFEAVIPQMWQRQCKEFDRPLHGPRKKIMFLTANRCDHNRGRHWDRKAA
jgi:hypothetical protein